MLTWIEIDSKAILHNLNQFRMLAGRETLIMPVIKANAYGHGFLCVAKICAKTKLADRICVVSADEARQLINFKLTKKPIMVLSFYELDQKIISELLKNDVRLPVYSIEQARFLNRVGKDMNKKALAHVKIDTGASRVGILPSQAVSFIKDLQKMPFVDVEGIFSHFASSEEDEVYTEKQYLTFQEINYELEKEKIILPVRHMACSASSLLFGKANFNGIRLGISLYGLYPSESVKDKLVLQPALSWYTKIIQVKQVPSGTKIGYGGTYQTGRLTKLAVIPVGYWDGYDRRFSNTVQVLVNGELCPVLGRVCMNLTMIDVTDVKGAKVSDKVTLIGKDKEKEVTVDALARIAGTINYEIVARINPLLPRVLV